MIAVCAFRFPMLVFLLLKMLSFGNVFGAFPVHNLSLLSFPVFLDENNFAKQLQPYAFKNISFLDLTRKDIRNTGSL